MRTPLPAVLTFLSAFVVIPALSRDARADLELPRPSPTAKITQQVGLTEVTVEYSCPGVKGRKIWDGLVPYDKMWRTGANTATKITFTKDVTFADKPVPAGSYALFTIPTKGAWTVVLNKNPNQPGTATDYKADLDFVRVQLRPKTAPFRERMAFMFSDMTDDKASLDLEWEKLRLSIPLGMGTTQQAMASITNAVDNTWRTYANAARYLVDTKKDLDTAMKYVDQSLSLKEDWFNVWVKASVLAAKGSYKDAVAQADKAMALGQQNGNFFLEGEVKKAIGDWKKKVK